MTRVYISDEENRTILGIYDPVTKVLYLNTAANADGIYVIVANDTTRETIA